MGDEERRGRGPSFVVVVRDFICAVSGIFGERSTVMSISAPAARGP